MIFNSQSPSPIFAPQRIISLCPSLTETLYALGLEDKIVGRTRFCIHPKEKIKDIAIVGGTKEVKYDKIRELNPDCILAVKEENTLEIVQTLSAEFPVYTLDVENIEQALEMIGLLGKITHKVAESKGLQVQIQAKWEEIVGIMQPLRTLYFIWKKPYMMAGRDTYIHDVLQYLGLKNIAISPESRYPELTIEAIKNLSPELILLSSEPYPFKDKHIAELKAVLPDAKILIVDGEMFTWYGSRMIEAADYLRNLAAN